MVRPPELTPQTQPQRGFTELFRLIRSLPSQSPDKSGVMGELCRIIRHLGRGIVWRPRCGNASYTRSKHLVGRDHACYWKSLDYGRGAGVGRERGVGRGLVGVGRIPW